MKYHSRLRIALLFGGRGAEHEVSLRSAASVARALVDASDLIFVGITKTGAIYLYTGSPQSIEDGKWESESTRLYPTSFVRLGEKRGLLLGGTVVPVDVVLPILHGDFGEDGKIQGWLEAVGLPYVGASPLAGSICQDKAVTKILAEHLSLPTVPWCTIRAGTSFAEAKLQIRATMPTHEFPLILKPTALGSSIGVFTATDDLSLREALKMSEPYGEMLIEQYLVGAREVEVCYLRAPEEHFFIGEVNLPDSNTPYTYDKKYNTSLSPLCEGKLPEEIESTLYRYCRALVGLLEMRELCRIDFLLDRSGKLYFNEINTLPGFSEHSFYPKVCKQNGWDYKPLLLSLCEAAYDRHLR